MALKVYSYSGCGTCRKALKWFSARKAAVTVLAIRETPPSKAELKAVLGVYGGELRRLFNTSGGDYKAMNMKERLPKLSESEALALLAANGNLVKRPFVVGAKGGAVGYDEAAWTRLLK